MKEAFKNGEDLHAITAAQVFGIPVKGTHAHSWVMFHDDELESFRAYARAMPNNCPFLGDTYDTLDGVRKLRAFSARGFNGEVRGIALDSNANIIFSGFTNTDFTFKGQSIDNTNAFAGFVVKVNKSGEVKWTKTLAEDASINAVAVDSADRVYLTGSFDNESTDFTPGVDGGEIEGASDQNQYAFVARLSKGGTFVWGKSMGASGGFSNTTARGR